MDRYRLGGLIYLGCNHFLISRSNDRRPKLIEEILEIMAIVHKPETREE